MQIAARRSVLGWALVTLGLLVSLGCSDSTEPVMTESAAVEANAAAVEATAVATTAPIAQPEPTAIPTIVPEPTAEPAADPTIAPEPTAEPAADPTIAPEPEPEPEPEIQEPAESATAAVATSLTMTVEAAGANETFTFTVVDTDREPFALGHQDQITLDGFGAEEFILLGIQVSEAWNVEAVDCVNARGVTNLVRESLSTKTAIEFGFDPVSCTVTMRPNVAINIVNDTVGERSPEVWTFTGPFGSIALRGGEQGVLFAPTSTRLEIAPTPVAGWSLTDVRCVGAADYIHWVAVFPSVLDVTTPGSGEVACTFIHERLAMAQVTLRKAVTGTAANSTFIIYSSGFPDQALAAGESATVMIAPGPINIAEEAAAGWLGANIVCTGVDALDQVPNAGFASFTASAGDIIECTSTSNPE